MRILFFAHLKDVTEECARDPDRWRIWTEVLLKTCNHPSVVGVSDLAVRLPVALFAIG